MSDEPLSCSEAIDFLDQYLDEALAPDVRRDFDAHLDRCPYCRDYLATYRDTIRMTKSLGPTADDKPCPLPEELIRAVRKTLEQSE